MGFKLLDFYKISPPVSGGETDPERSVRFKRIRWATFLSATTGYGIYYFRYQEKIKNRNRKSSHPYSVF